MVAVESWRRLPGSRRSESRGAALDSGLALVGGGPRRPGVIAGIWAEKFDQLAAFQNFLVMPLTMLSGVFYSIHSLPDIRQSLPITILSFT